MYNYYSLLLKKEKILKFTKTKVFETYGNSYGIDVTPSFWNT